MEDNKFVLEVSDLHTTFKTDNGDVSAVNGVSFKQAGKDSWNRRRVRLRKVSYSIFNHADSC